ncbi:hypothetical protein CIB84_004825 [Bambusicola thoracicus]|uniref:Uncharacterized protein n=1 Tax=Bambusicola thoracicus TaxID=9083 RepID=A0A2P4T516_BAMTH|nr:hypothetical protein CIB84_004825 [Bambusicola thoracicus]
MPSSSSVQAEESGYAGLTSTLSELCQKCHRIQNHIKPLSTSLHTTCDRVSSGNCRYRGSMCTSPPALQQTRRRLTPGPAALTSAPFSPLRPTHCRLPAATPPTRSSRPAERPSDASMAAPQCHKPIAQQPP